MESDVNSLLYIIIAKNVVSGLFFFAQEKNVVCEIIC